MRYKRRTKTEGRPLGTGLLGRAWRQRRRGEHRGAMLTLREACNRDSDSARLWTLYAAACVRAGRREEATRALKQALWIRQRSHDDTRAEITRAILTRIEQGEASLRVAVS